MCALVSRVMQCRRRARVGRVRATCDGVSAARSRRLATLVAQRAIDTLPPPAAPTCRLPIPPLPNIDTFHSPLKPSSYPLSPNNSRKRKILATFINQNFILFLVIKKSYIFLITMFPKYCTIFRFC